MPLEQRKINVTFQIGEGNFGTSGFNTVTLENLRCIADLSMAGGGSMGYLKMRVYGMPRSLMNQLSTMGMKPALVRLNTVIVEAGTAGAMATVFRGNIVDAFARYNAQPDVYFDVSAAAGFFDRNTPAAGTSYNGRVDVANVLRDLAQKMGIAFNNDAGVSVILDHPHFSNSLGVQVEEAAHQAGVEYEIENGTLVIWPKGGVRRTSSVPLISPETGLVGYPDYSSMGLNLTTIYNPAIVRGGVVEVRSSLPQANGKWKVWNMVHNLSSEVPGGPWFTNLEVTNFGLGVGLPG